MKFTQLITFIPSGFATCLLASSLITGNLKEQMQVAVGSTVAAIGTAHIVGQINQKKVSELEDKLTRSQQTVEKLEEGNDSKLKAQITRNSEIFKTLTDVQEQIRVVEKSKQDLIKSQVSKISEMETVKQSLIKKLETSQNQLEDSQRINDQQFNQIRELNNQIIQLQTEAEEESKNFDKLFELRANQRVNELTADYDALIEDSLKLKDGLAELMGRVRKKSRSNKEYLVKTIEKGNELMGNVEDKFNVERDNYANQIEILNEKVARLQQELDGILIEPEYLNVGYALHGKIANDIAKLFFELSDIPLKVLGYQQDEELTRVGYGYSKNAIASDIIQSLKNLSVDIAKGLRIHSISSVELSNISPVINLTFRKEPPKPETHEAIYKAGLIPASQFCDTVAKATDTKKKGKPTLRVMAATGEGKGIAVKNLLAYFANIEGWEIWLSDPLHGSDEDYWDTPKIATTAKDAGKAYDLFLQLHKERKDLKQPGFTDRNVLGVFDEFDKQHSKDDKEQAKEIMTAIRHSNQRQILIGQCAEVGSNGWTWDDMKNCSLLVLGASIGSLIKHLRTDFGWSTKKVNQVKREYEKFSQWADNQNDSNPDIPDENQTRIGLLVVGDKYQFLELPIAHKGILKDGKAIFRTILTATPAQPTEKVKPIAHQALNTSLPTTQKCPNCGSTNIGSNGKLRNRCRDCNKTWKK